jgi:PAS domain S-box-containing protein
VSEAKKETGANIAGHGVQFAADALVRLVGETVTITEAASQILRSSESRYRRLFETARDGILLLNAESAQIEDVNPYLIEMLGYSHAEFLGKKLWEVGAFADIAQSKEMFAVLQDKGYIRYQNLPLTTHSGKRIAVEFVSNSYDCAGVKVIQCNIRDMTAHNEADILLREFKAIVNGSNDAIISKSLDGIIKSWNPGAEKLFGYTAQEAIGNDLSLVVPQDRIKEESEILLHVARGEKMPTFDTVRRRKDGQLIDVCVTISPILDGSGNMVGVSKITRDITERKAAEARRASLESQLRESQKMEAIGTLAGGIAHDFNNIIATILGNSELARQDSSSNPQALQSIEEIRKAGTRGRALVQQILTFSRRQPTDRKAIALAPVIDESVRLLRASIPPRISIAIHCDTDLPKVLADATQIEQIVVNLATNAMQAIAGNGRIEIRLDTASLDPALVAAHSQLRSLHDLHSGCLVRLTVSDTGCGIDTLTVNKIFEPFFTTKPAGEGTGLGLSVVFGIAQTHEGTITVDSTIGKGTTFTVYFPIAEGVGSVPTGEASTVTTKSKQSLGEHVLYLDDDEALAYLVKRLLERRGYRVSDFTDQDAALAALRANPASFDLVLTDYNMPGMSGLDVAREVRNIRSDLPVALTSGFIDKELQQQAAGAGVRELIFKADAVEVLCDAVQRVIEGIEARPC